MQNNLYFIL